MTERASTVNDDNRRGGKGLRAFLLCLAILVAAGLRFADLDRWPLWVDELATLQRLDLTFPEHVAAMRGNHPLYELLLRCWAFSGSSDARVRVPSAVMGVVSVWLLWLALRRTNRWAALLAAWLLALSPLHLMYSRIARAYSFAAMLALLNLLAFQWALRRRGALPLLTYVIVTAALIYANLIAVVICIAQGLFILWFFRRRPRRVVRWILAGLGVAALIAPWMVYSMPGAVEWGVETQYTARQFGHWAKAAYLPLTFSLGETVHPLNLKVVIPAFVGFGGLMLLAFFRTIRRRRPLMVLLLLQVLAGYGVGLAFDAAASKHLLVIVPSYCGLIAFGLAHLSRKHVPWAVLLGILVFGTSVVSDANYFAGREFADADMVTPWREIVATVETEEMPGEKILIGYRPDPGAYDMFCRYYFGRLSAEHLDFDDWRGEIAGDLERHGSVWLLLHDGDPWADAEAWFRNIGVPHTMTPFQEEEHTLQGLREGWRNAGKYTSPLYRLYHIHLPSS
jgi:hypothetical protein